MKGRDFALLTDLYELTMMQGYYETGAHKRQVVFDLFYRKNPSGNGYAIAAGLQQAIEYLDELRFSDEDIAYLESLNIFSEGASKERYSWYGSFSRFLSLSTHWPLLTTKVVKSRRLNSPINSSILG